MKYFRHDSNAAQDAKIKKLIFQHGAEGYAVYFHCLELINGNVSEKNVSFSLEHDSETIADNLKIRGNGSLTGAEEVNTILDFILELGLFTKHGDTIHCFKLLERFEMSMVGPSLRKLIKAAQEKVRINHDQVRIPHDKSRLGQDLSRHTILDVADTTTPETSLRSVSAPKGAITNPAPLENSPAQLNADSSPSSSTPKKRTRFTPPTLEEVADYCKERNNTVKPQYFIDHYESNGWMVGKNKMKDWRAAVRKWENSNYNNGSSNGSGMSSVGGVTAAEADKYLQPNGSNLTTQPRNGDTA